MFDQVTDMKYMLDNNTLLMSAVRSGQTDLFVYKITQQSYDQITNDVYDDLDPAFVAFPNKTGIIFSSNRPSANPASSEDSLISRDLSQKLLAHLPDDDRALLHLLYADEMSVAQIGELLGWSVSKVKIRAWRARHSLRKVLKKYV